ncbi:hypothetical protein Pelo_11320 [Pelomyxa schiedti]|nr:hypothetical protein Pelo_11320 [Pelomyxa schiedti]
MDVAWISALENCPNAFASELHPAELLLLSQVCMAFRYGPLSFTGEVWWSLLDRNGVSMCRDPAECMVQSSRHRSRFQSCRGLPFAGGGGGRSGDCGSDDDEATISTADEYRLDHRGTPKLVSLTLFLKHDWCGVAQIRLLGCGWLGYTQKASSGGRTGASRDGAPDLHRADPHDQAATAFAITPANRLINNSNNNPTGDPVFFLEHISSGKVLSLRPQPRHSGLYLRLPEKRITSWDVFQLEHGSGIPLRRINGPHVLVTPLSTDSFLRYQRGDDYLSTSLSLPVAKFQLHYLYIPA